MANLTRNDKFYQKKSISVFAGALVEGQDGVLAETGNYKLANLPEDALITNAYVNVITASDAATTAAATLGTAEGGSQLLTAVNLKTAGKQGTFAGQRMTGTGAELWLNTTITGAATAVAKYLVVVEYLEFNKATGEYTKFD